MKRIEGVLEIDEERGVVYFTAFTADPPEHGSWLRIRICGLPKPVPSDVSEIDITVNHGVSYN